MMHKRCRKCGEVRKLEYFPQDRKSRDGRHSWCRTCKARANGQYKARRYRTFEQVAAEADIWTQLQRDIEAVARKDAQRALGIRV